MLARAIVGVDVHPLMLDGAVHTTHLCTVGGEPDIRSDQQVSDAGPRSALIDRRWVDLRARWPGRVVLCMIPHGNRCGPVAPTRAEFLARPNDLPGHQSRWQRDDGSPWLRKAA